MDFALDRQRWYIAAIAVVSGKTGNTLYMEYFEPQLHNNSHNVVRHAVDSIASLLTAGASSASSDHIECSGGGSRHQSQYMKKTVDGVTDADIDAITQAATRFGDETSCILIDFLLQAALEVLDDRLLLSAAEYCLRVETHQQNVNQSWSQQPSSLSSSSRILSGGNITYSKLPLASDGGYQVYGHVTRGTQNRLLLVTRGADSIPSANPSSQIPSSPPPPSLVGGSGTARRTKSIVNAGAQLQQQQQKRSVADGSNSNSKDTIAHSILQRLAQVMSRSLCNPFLNAHSYHPPAPSTHTTQTQHRHMYTLTTQSQHQHVLRNSPSFNFAVQHLCGPFLPR